MPVHQSYIDQVKTNIRDAQKKVIFHEAETRVWTKILEEFKEKLEVLQEADRIMKEMDERK